MIAYGKTDVGRVRVSNQDAFCIHELSDGAMLAVVCDGMGGAKAGNVASTQAVNAVLSYIKRSYRSGLSPDALIQILKSAIHSANIEVYDMAKSNTELEGMGTTVVAAIASERFTVIAHVGDSRAYLIADEAVQLTRDHSVVQSLIESGKLSVEEAKVHPRKNVITRALGTEEDVLVDGGEYAALSTGESLLLCTDGLTNFVDTSEITDIFTKTEGEQTVQVLIARANHNGGGDNITVVTVAMQQKG